MVIIMEKKLAIGVDIGGTSIKGAAITSEGKVLDVFSMPVIKGDSQEKVVNDLIKVINDYLKQHQYRHLHFRNQFVLTNHRSLSQILDGRIQK